MRDGNAAGNGVVDALFAPTAGDIVTLVDFRQQRRDVLGCMLQVAVERDHHAALRLIEAGRERGRLAEVAPQTNHFEAMIGLHQVGQQVEAAIRGGVVDEDNLVGLLQALQHRR